MDALSLKKPCHTASPEGADSLDQWVIAWAQALTAIADKQTVSGNSRIGGDLHAGEAQRGPESGHCQQINDPSQPQMEAG